MAFEKLKDACTSTPILGFADYTKPFVLNTDASIDGLGAVLQQEQDGRTRVIAFASRSLSKSEKNYPIHKLEFLALKWAITEKFHDYLYGNEFTVFTDNNPLTYILTTAKLDATGQRWVALLANYPFAIKYCAGTSNRVADALSLIITVIQYSTIPNIQTLIAYHKPAHSFPELQFRTNHPKSLCNNKHTKVLSPCLSKPNKGQTVPFSHSKTLAILQPYESTIYK